MQENGLSLLMQEMENEEIQAKVHAIRRMKTVILSMGPVAAVSQLIPYLQ